MNQNVEVLLIESTLGLFQPVEDHAVKHIGDVERLAVEGDEHPIRGEHIGEVQQQALLLRVIAREELLDPHIHPGRARVFPSRLSRSFALPCLRITHGENAHEKERAVGQAARLDIQKQGLPRLAARPPHFVNRG